MEIAFWSLNYFTGCVIVYLSEFLHASVDRQYRFLFRVKYLYACKNVYDEGGLVKLLR